jgi:ribosomal protein S18 acetylase RimI-like enzyme
MKIRKAKKQDLKEYMRLRGGWEAEYSRMLGGADVFASKSQIKKEFSGFFTKDYSLLIAEEGKEIIGYLACDFVTNSRLLYIGDIFVKREFRKKGIGKILINGAKSIAKARKFKKIRLGVNLKNKSAILFYRKIGFKVSRYEMDLRLK